MTAALEGDEWSAARPGRTLSPGKTQYPFYRRLGGRQGRSGRAENLVPTDIRSRTVQTVVSRYTDWATRPTGIPTVLINTQLDATVCNLIYFTAKSLYMFRVSIAPIIRSTKNCNCSLRYRSYCETVFHSQTVKLWNTVSQYDLYRRLRLQFLVLLMIGAVETRNL